MADQVQLVSSDFNLIKLNTAQLSKNLEYSIQIGSNVVVVGRRGSGKTEIAKQRIKAANRKEVYINLSVAERTDMGGYPDMFGTMTKEEKARRFVNVLLPQFFAPLMEGDEPCVALLDEVDKADPSIWGPLLEFLQFKSINGTKLKNLESVIMTGNLISEGGKRPSLPLLDRAEKYLVEASVDHWLQWAGNSGSIHPSIAAYVADHPNHLFGAVETEENYADPSPRGWYLASQALFKLEKFSAPQDLRINKVGGFVGKQIGLLFAMYYTYYSQVLPMVDSIFEGGPLDKIIDSYNSKFDPAQKLVTSMIVCGRLGTQSDMMEQPEDARKLLTHVGKFLRHCTADNILVGVRSQFGVDRLAKWDLNEDPVWKEVLGKVTNNIQLA